MADKNMMKDAIRASETLYIEQAMYEDKLRATEIEATNDAISEAVLRESRLQFMRDQEKQMAAFMGATTSNPRSVRLLNIQVVAQVDENFGLFSRPVTCLLHQVSFQMCRQQAAPRPVVLRR